MSLPGSTATAVDGSLLATQTIGALELLVNLPADSVGHVLGTRTEWFVFSAPLAHSGTLELLELFNAQASTIVRVRGVWIVPTQSAISAAQITYDLNRISTVGSTGSTVETPRPLDTTYAALPAGITARRSSTAGATVVSKYVTQFNWNEEQDTVNVPPMPQLQNQTLGTTNLLPVLGDRVVEIVLQTNEGLQVKVVSGLAGLASVFMYFAVDN